MLDFLWEYQQQRRLVDVEAVARRAERDAGDTKYKAWDHQGRLDTMALTIMAMWSMMEERFSVTEAQLVQRMQEIDLRDGKLDGKAAPTAGTCGDCRRVMSSQYKRCIYCGGESLEVRPFAGI